MREYAITREIGKVRLAQLAARVLYSEECRRQKTPPPGFEETPFDVLEFTLASIRLACDLRALSLWATFYGGTLMSEVDWRG